MSYVNQHFFLRRDSSDFLHSKGERALRRMPGCRQLHLGGVSSKGRDFPGKRWVPTARLAPVGMGQLPSAMQSQGTATAAHQHLPLFWEAA